MFAIINGQTGVVEEYLTNRISKNTIYWSSDLIKETKQTIPHLLFQFCPGVHPKILLKRKDLTPGNNYTTDRTLQPPVSYSPTVLQTGLDWTRLFIIFPARRDVLYFIIPSRGRGNTRRDTKIAI